MGFRPLGPAQPGPVLIEGHFWVWPTVGWTAIFWPKLGIVRKMMAQTQLFLKIGSGYGPAWPSLAWALLKVILAQIMWYWLK